MTEKTEFKNPEADSLLISQSDFDDLLELQSSILDIATSTENCNDLMKELCIKAEKLAPNAVASIMLYNKTEAKLYVHAAPSIPQEAVDALNGLDVGAGSCGNAVYHKEAMYVGNTCTDKRWDQTRSFAEAFNISACWSVPVFDEINEVVGTFAISSFEEREPTNFQRKLLDTCSHIAGILLQKEKYQLQNSQIEKDTHRYEKLESIGVLAGGIAHDFNNLLSIVIGNLEMVERTENLNSKAATYISSATNASKRAADLTQQLLTFSKGGTPLKKLTDLRELIKESAEFVLHGSGVSLSLEFLCARGSVMPAYIDSGQISQVLQNIVINARQAMGDSGKINIICNTIDIKGKGFRDIKEGKYHEVRIINTGPNIAQDIIEKIFDPYFTTKSEGNGLGLALSFSIIKKHDGYLYVDDKADGACFVICLPASDEKIEKEPENEKLIRSSESKGRVLVMDDEKMLFDMVEMILEDLGYQAVYANDGLSALKIYEEEMNRSNPIDLTIMDLTIPGGMGGEEAVREMLKLDVSAKVVVSSGYSNDSVMANFEDYGFKGSLSKPYRIEELNKLLNKILVK